MISLIRTDSSNEDFRILVAALDKDLAIRDGDDHSFYSQYNTINLIKHVIVAYDAAIPVACGAIKEYAPGIAEVKRMYVLPDRRGEGIASVVLNALESWAQELHYSTCILETGLAQPEAIALYKKNHYVVTANYGQYAGVAGSVCFEKNIG